MEATNSELTERLTGANGTVQMVHDGAPDLDNQATTAGDTNEKFVLMCDDEEMMESCCSPAQQVPERPFQRSAASIRNETDFVGRVRRVSFLKLLFFFFLNFYQD